MEESGESLGLRSDGELLGNRGLQFIGGMATLQFIGLSSWLRLTSCTLALSSGSARSEMFRQVGRLEAAEGGFQDS